MLLRDPTSLLLDWRFVVNTHTNHIWNQQFLITADRMETFLAANLTRPPFLVLSVWSKIYRSFGENDKFMFSFATWFVAIATYWITNLALLYVDITGKPKFLSRYKVQKDKNAPLDPKLLPKVFRTVFMNMMVVLPVVFYATCLMSVWRGMSCGYDVPSLPRILLDLAVAVVCEEILFYYSHRSVPYEVPPDDVVDLDCDRAKWNQHSPLGIPLPVYAFTRIPRFSSSEVQL
ncbi:fatty acid hydroxylase domain-containing protein 2-like isoform X2 [Ptychodera flava]|uniref:fatty acid hydroxylase domain-containing protein 2-like isoform X2 n=1 Tax=Ptychodera flava TaxID=63121 RepID=UPI003969F381